MTAIAEEFCLPGLVKKRAQNRSSEELEMRALVVPELRKRWPSARIIHELPLRYSSNRIDLAAVTPTEIVSVEIKSSKDVTDRLEAQLRAFDPISTRMIVALAPKWNEQLPNLVTKTETTMSIHQQFTEAQTIIRGVSSQIDIWTADVAAGKLTVTHDVCWRKHKPWLAQMLHMLHVSELAHIAGHHRVALGKRPTHEGILQECCDLMTGREIVKSVCWALRTRHAFDKASDPPTDETLAGEKLAPKSDDEVAA